jgi:hypothetical protein
MEIRDLVWATDPLHFQFPPTKNLRASTFVDDEYALSRRRRINDDNICEKGYDSDDDHDHDHDETGETYRAATLETAAEIFREACMMSSL